jgi:2-dehydropantoate 2-reductase
MNHPEHAPRSYAVIGTGALGGFYGGRLQRAGLDVHFLLRSDYDHVRRNGLVIDSVDGDFTLPHVNAYAAASDMPRCDVALVALKSTANHVLPDILPHVVDEDGVVLMLQNGLGAEDEVARFMDPHPVLGGLAFICCNKIGPGHIDHMDYIELVLAHFRRDHQPAGVTPELEAVAADFRRADVKTTLNEDLVNARWRKLVWNVPYNGLCVVARTTTDRVMASPDLRSRAELLMWDVVRGAAACGHAIEAGFVRTMLEHTNRMTPYRPSMLLDYEQGQPMEIESIFGNPLRAARKAGVELDALAELYEELKAVGKLE